MSGGRAETLTRRAAASRKGAATRKRMAAFLATGAPVQDAPEPGSGPRGEGQRMGWSIPDIMARIRAAGGR